METYDPRSMVMKTEPMESAKESMVDELDLISAKISASFWLLSSTNYPLIRISQMLQALATSLLSSQVDAGVHNLYVKFIVVCQEALP